MANQQGFDGSAGVGALSKLFAHYDRTKLYDDEGHLMYAKYDNLTVRGMDSTFNQSEIDPERTHLNYNLGPSRSCTQAEFVERRLSEVYVHARAKKNLVVDWIVTLPNMKQYEGRESEFFKTCYNFMAKRYGEENVISCFVHMDETNPHIHFAFLPIVPDEKHEEGWKLSKKAVNTCPQVDPKTHEPVLDKNGNQKINTRSFSYAFHKELGEYVCEEMGLDESGIRLTQEQKEKRNIEENLASSHELKAQSAALERIERKCEAAEAERKRLENEIKATGERLERVRQAEDATRKEVEGLEREVGEIEDEIRALDSTADRNERETEELAGKLKRARSENARGNRDLEKKREALARRVGNLESRLGNLEGVREVTGAVEEFRADAGRGNLRSALDTLLARIEGVVGTVRSRLAALADKAGEIINRGAKNAAAPSAAFQGASQGSRTIDAQDRFREWSR